MVKKDNLLLNDLELPVDMVVLWRHAHVIILLYGHYEVM